jgi:hypothetical protein
MRDVRADLGAEPAEFHGKAGHVRLLVNFPPTVAISRLLNSLQRRALPPIEKEFADLRHHYRKAKRHGPGPTSPDQPTARITVFPNTSQQTAYPDWPTLGRVYHQPASPARWQPFGSRPGRSPHLRHAWGGRWSRVPGAVRWEGDHRHGCP